MSVSSFFTLGNAIRAMSVFGLVALLLVIVQSCQKPKTGLDAFAKASLKPLTVLQSPPSLPRMTFTSADGTTVNLQDRRGQVVLLNIWATWCAPCLKEMPTLDALQADMGGPDFQVVTVSLDRTAAEAQAWFEKNNIRTLTPYHDGTYRIAGDVKAPGLPTTILYGRNGQELARLAGDADWNSTEARALFRHVIDR